MIIWDEPDWPVQRSKDGKFCVVKATNGDDDTDPWFVAYELASPILWRVIAELRSAEEARRACE